MRAETIAKESLATLDAAIKDLVFKDQQKPGRPAERKEQLAIHAAQLIEHIFTQAFDKVEKGPKEEIETEKKIIFKKFSLALHPDKIGKNQSLIANLQYIGVANDFPISVLNVKRDKANVLAEIADNPISGMKAVIAKLFRATPYFLFADNRYPQPLRFFAKAIDWVINISLVIGAIGMSIILLIFYSAIEIAGWLERKCINLLTSDQYDKEVEDYKNDPLTFIKAERNCFSNARNAASLSLFFMEEMEGMEWMEWMEGIEGMEWMKEKEKKEAMKKSFEAVLGMNDKSIRHVMFSEKVQSMPGVHEDIINKIIDDEIRETISTKGLIHIKLVAKAMFHSVFAPFPRGFFKIIQSIFVRTLQLLVTPVFIALAIGTQALRYLNALANISTLMAIVAIKAINVSVVSWPIFLYDAVCELANILKSCCDFSAEKAADGVNGDYNNSQQLSEEPLATLAITDGSYIQQQAQFSDRPSTNHDSSSVRNISRALTSFSSNNSPIITREQEKQEEQVNYSSIYNQRSANSNWSGQVEVNCEEHDGQEYDVEEYDEKRSCLIS